MSLLSRRHWIALASAGTLSRLQAQGPVPRPSPDFVVTLDNGQKITLGQYRGKVVVLAFLSST